MTDEFKVLKKEIVDLKNKLTTINSKKEEAFTKGVQAIDAWKQSPIYQIYMQIGLQSVTDSKPIADVIIDRQVKNQPVITVGEFEAINKLNKELTI